MKDGYLEKNLTPQEIVYLTKIIQSAKSKYIEGITKYKIQYVELEKADKLKSMQIKDIVFHKLSSLIKAETVGKEFENELLVKAIDKVLTKNERSVLFSFFYEEKTTVNISKDLSLT